MPRYFDSDEERRSTDPYTAMMEAVLKELQELRQRAVLIETLEALFKQHVKTEEEFQTKLEHHLLSAFPDGDTALHRAHHDMLISREKFKEQFFKNLLEKIGQGTIVGLLGVLGALVVYWLRGTFTFH